jgi:hypothetical protein
MKVKKENTSGLKTINKPSSDILPALSDHQKLTKEFAKTDESHHKIVKRLMSHSQYNPITTTTTPANLQVKNESISPPPNQNNVAQVAGYHPYTISHYPSYDYHHQIYNNNNNNVNDFYQKDFYLQEQQQLPSYGYNNVTPPLISPPTYDQISNDYIFNGDFSVNFNGTDFDASFPLIDGITSNKSPSSQLLYDNDQAQTEFEIKQLSPIKIQSYDGKKCFNDDSNQSIPLPSVAVNWKFSEPQMAAY